MTSGSVLKQMVEEELKWEPSLDATAVSVSVDDGVVALTGRVPSYAARVAAEKAVKRVGGVQGVKNELVIALPWFGVREDAEIERAASLALEWNSSLQDRDIRVSVDHGWLTLAGEVEWRHEREAAFRAVHALSGVVGVLNDIRVKPRATSRELKSEIVSALQRSAALDAQAIQVDADEGRVRLSGTVRSWAEYKDAERAAWAGRGVVSVDNQLVVAERAVSAVVTER